MSRYTYGDSDLAAERLGLVASMFERTTEAFVRQVVREPSGLVLDLGCGPGYTTRLLHRVTGAVRTIGMDRSRSFLEAARAGAPAGVGFVEHDATRVPFPTGPADLVYARLLLAHLPDPEDVCRRWSTMLTIGGSLLLDDLEAIDAPEPVFRAYLDDVAVVVVRAQGGHLFVGPILHTMVDPEGTDRLHDEIAAFSPPPRVTARVFGMNLAVLIERGEIPERRDLSQALGAIARGERSARPATWHVRQIALRRRGSWIPAAGRLRPGSPR